jgi:hypothetical protein
MYPTAVLMLIAGLTMLSLPVSRAPSKDQSMDPDPTVLVQQTIVVITDCYGIGFSEKLLLNLTGGLSYSRN